MGGGFSKIKTSEFEYNGRQSRIHEHHEFGRSKVAIGETHTSRSQVGGKMRQQKHQCHD